MVKIKKQISGLYLSSVLGNLSLTGAWVAILAARGFSLPQIGFAETVFHITSLLFELPSGVLADVFGRKNMLILSSIMRMISNVIMIFSQSFASICLSMVFCAMSFNFASGSGDALAYDSMKEAGAADQFERYESSLLTIYRLCGGASTLCAGFALSIGYKLAYGMDPDTGVSFQTAPLADSFLYNKAALVTLDPEGILEIVNSTMNPYLRDVELSDLEVVCRNSNGTFSVTSGTLADPKMGGSSSGSSGSGSGTQSTPVQPSATPEPAQEEPGAAGEDEPAEEENAGQSSAAQGGEEEQPASGEDGQSPGTEQGTQVPQPPAEEPPAEEPVQPAQSGDAEPQAGGEELPPETP